MTLRQFDPVNEFVSMREAMNRMLEQSFVRPGFLAATSRVTSFSPAVDVYERREEVVVRVALPGVEAHQVDVTYVDGALVISGQVANPAVQAGEQNQPIWHLQEIDYGSFRRVVPLPKPVKPEQIQATIEHGILTLEVPKADEARLHQIKITPSTGEQLQQGLAGVGSH